MINANDVEFVILAAGKSTRNYPHSKGLPHKALLPLGSVKIIDKIIREPIDSGIKNITIVVSDIEAQKAFESCFTHEKSIVEKFEKTGNKIGLELLQSIFIPEDISIKYVIQSEPKGTGHAVGLVAQKCVGKYLAVRLPDDLLLPRHKKDAPFVKKVLEGYLASDGGNLFITKKTNNPSRFGIVKDGLFTEKPTGLRSGEASFVLMIFDKSYAAVLAEKASLVEKKGSAEYEKCAAGGEIHYCDWINDFIAKNPEMAIRTAPLDKTCILLDGGTLQGYEEAMIYTLLHDSMFAKRNRKIAKAQCGIKKWFYKLGWYRKK